MRHTIVYRGEHVHFADDQPIKWLGQEFPDQKAAHTAINAICFNGKKPPSILPTLKAEIRADGLQDPHGTCMAWKFALADYMEQHHDGAPDEWEFAPSPFGANTEAWEYETLELFQPTREECEQLAATLHRWDGMNRSRNVNY